MHCVLSIQRLRWNNFKSFKDSREHCQFNFPILNSSPFFARFDFASSVEVDRGFIQIFFNLAALVLNLTCFILS